MLDVNLNTFGRLGPGSGPLSRAHLICYALSAVKKAQSGKAGRDWTTACQGIPLLPKGCPTGVIVRPRWGCGTRVVYGCRLVRLQWGAMHSRLMLADGTLAAARVEGGSRQ
jgi:hypothetical protein